MSKILNWITAVVAVVKQSIDLCYSVQRITKNTVITPNASITIAKTSKNPNYIKSKDRFVVIECFNKKNDLLHMNNNTF